MEKLKVLVFIQLLFSSTKKSCYSPFGGNLNFSLCSHFLSLLLQCGTLNEKMHTLPTLVGKLPDTRNTSFQHCSPKSGHSRERCAVTSAFCFYEPLAFHTDSFSRSSPVISRVESLLPS